MAKSCTFTSVEAGEKHFPHLATEMRIHISAHSGAVDHQVLASQHISVCGYIKISDRKAH